MNIKKEGGIVGFTDETVRFNLDDSNRKEISDTLKDVYLSLDEKGYNPINQIVGYVLSGDPAYVPRYNMPDSILRQLFRMPHRSAEKYDDHSSRSEPFLLQNIPYNFVPTRT